MKVGQGGAGTKVGPGESLHRCPAKSSAEQHVSHKQSAGATSKSQLKSGQTAGGGCGRRVGDTVTELHTVLGL